MVRRFRGFVASSATFAIIVGTLVGVAPTSPASALDGAQFDPGYIISDERFYDPNSMSVADIQSFLNAQVPRCAATDPNLPCLKDYVGMTNSKAAAGVNHCTAYDSYGWESAAQIIWRVAQACRINPQVLLATLQKEQGLVTSTKPSAWSYQAAMGYGCPDTAPCATQYYGFFNQMYWAAWQFRQYTKSPNYWRHRIGTVNVYFHPDIARCGSSPVYIRNQATANLYNYTPYQPNAAALRDLWGVGGDCSSYGNRNFWRTFSVWFGDPTANGAPFIDALHREYGGSEGILGAPTSGMIVITDNGVGTARVYQNGSIYWTPATGAHSVIGTFRDRYWASSGSSGVIGWPDSERIPLAGITGGEAQAFTGGSLYASPATGVRAVLDPLRASYFAFGGGTGPLGLPIAEQVAAPSARGAGIAQDFQQGALYQTPGGVTTAVVAPMLATYRSLGGPNGALGWPVTNRGAISQNGGGFGQPFEGGSMYSSAAGAFAVSGAVLSHYWSLNGAAGSLGWPTGPQVCGAGGACEQPFQNGTIYVSPDTAPRVGLPAIEATYTALGGGSGVLGARLSGLIPIPQNGGGFGQSFAGGPIYASAAGAFAVTGSILSHYWSLNGAAGSLGWPTGAQVCGTGGACEQPFQKGSIYVTPSTAPRVGLPAIETLYASLGGASGVLGARASGLIPIPQNGGGYGQSFAGGSAYASEAGAFAVMGGIRNHYWALNGSAGSLGWPTGPQVCGSGGACEQPFQNGTIYFSPSTGARVGLPAIEAAYAALGGATGVLGARTSGLIAIPQNGGGYGQAFVGGSIYASAAGAFAVTGGVLSQYWALNGAAGTLGWPTAAQTCTTGGVCTQRFQNGTIEHSVATGARVLR